MVATTQDTIQALEATQKIASAAQILPGPAGVVAGIVQEALGLAILITQSGRDPLEHLKRLKREEDLLSGTRKRILDKLKRKSGGSDS